MLRNGIKICLLCVHEVIVFRLMNLYFRLDSTGLEFKKGCLASKNITNSKPSTKNRPWSNWYFLVNSSLNKKFIEVEL